MSVEVTRFRDEHGIEHVVRRHRGRLAIENASGPTPVVTLNRRVATLLGANIRAARLARGFTLAELCRRAGLRTTTPKQRMAEIETARREYGLRLGTLYAIADALEVEVAALLPTRAEVDERP